MSELTTTDCASRQSQIAEQISRRDSILGQREDLINTLRQVIENHEERIASVILQDNPPDPEQQSGKLESPIDRPSLVRLADSIRDMNDADENQNDAISRLIGRVRDLTDRLEL